MEVWSYLITLVPQGFPLWDFWVYWILIADFSANSSLISKEKNTTKSPAENLNQKCQYCANIFLFGGFWNPESLGCGKLQRVFLYKYRCHLVQLSSQEKWSSNKGITERWRETEVTAWTTSRLSTTRSTWAIKFRCGRWTWAFLAEEPTAKVNRASKNSRSRWGKRG